MQLKVNGSVHCTRIPLGLNICLRSEFIELGYTQFKSVFIPTRLICLKCQIRIWLYASRQNPGSFTFILKPNHEQYSTILKAKKEILVAPL